MRNQDQSIHILLNLAKQSKENNVSWSGGFDMGTSILEFARSKGIITDRQKRALVTEKGNVKKTQDDAIECIEKFFKPETEYFWSLFCTLNDDSSEPVMIPNTVSSDGKIFLHREEMEKLILEQPEILEKNKLIRRSLRRYKELTDSIYGWIYLLFVKGNLESEIENYLISKAEKKKKNARLSMSLVDNFMKPGIANRVEGDGETPQLSIQERQTLQFLIWKSQNMDEMENRFKTLLLNGMGENEGDSLIVVFEETEVIKLNYGKNKAESFHYKEISESLDELSNKKRKLLITTKDEEIKLSLPFIKKYELEHRYKFDPEFKKYVIVKIDKNIIDLRDKYATFPENHFALLRETPPKTKLTELEVAFFDFLYKEVPFDLEKPKVVKRNKRVFLKSFDIDGTIEKNHHFPRLADKIEGDLHKKAINLGIISKFEVCLNGKGEEVYHFHIQPRKQIPVFS